MHTLRVHVENITAVAKRTGIMRCKGIEVLKVILKPREGRKSVTGQYTLTYIQVYSKRIVGTVP